MSLLVTRRVLPLTRLSLAVPRPNRRTLQRWLNHLIVEGQLERLGQGRAVQYRLAHRPKEAEQTETLIPLSPAAKNVERLVRQPFALRKPVGYSCDFVDSYRPNETYYLPQNTRDDLKTHGLAVSGSEPAGTCAPTCPPSVGRLVVELQLPLGQHLGRPSPKWLRLSYVKE